MKAVKRKVRKMEKPNKLLVIVGESGCGKTSIAERLQQYGLKLIQSYTTRPKRKPLETGHTFVTKEDFDKISDKVAYLKKYGAEYCTTKQQVEDCDICILDPNSARVLKKNYNGDKKILTIYIKTSIDTRYTNMTRRRKDSERAAMNRILEDNDIFKGVSEIADYIIENESTDLDVLCAYIYNEIYKGDNI